MGSPNEDQKAFIRIFLHDEKSNPIICKRNDGYQTTIDELGYEDLLLQRDKAKINLYSTIDYIDLYNGKTYKVIKRSFMPCSPVCLYLTLEEIK